MHSYLSGLGAALCAALLVGCGDTPVVPTPQGQSQPLDASITLTPDSAAGWAPEGITIRVRISGPDGDSLGKLPVAWSAADPSLVALSEPSDTSVIAIPQHDGVALVIATVGEATDTAKVVCWEEGAPLAVTEYSATSLTFMQSVSVGTDGMIYLPTYEDAFYAFDADLAPAWQVAIQGAVWMNGTVADDGNLILPSWGGLTMLSSTGAVLWQDTAFSTVESAAAIDSRGDIWVGGVLNPTDTLQTLGLAHYNATGSRLTFMPMGIKVAPVIVQDSVVVVGDLGRLVYGISRMDSILWVDTLASPVRYFGPAVAGDGRTVYVAARNGPVAAIDGLTGEIHWTRDDGLGWPSPPIVDADGTIYVQEAPGLVAFEADGSVRWRADSLGAIHGVNALTAPALAAGGVLYVPCRYDVCAVNTADGSVRWRHALPSEVPDSTSAGTILILPDSSILFSTVQLPYGFKKPSYLIKLRGRYPLADAPWPVDGGDLRRTRRGHTP